MKIFSLPLSDKKFQYPRLILMLLLLLAAVVGVMSVHVGGLLWVILIGVGFSLILLWKPHVIPQITLFSVIFFRYQFDIGSVSINLFRVLVLATLISLFFIKVRIDGRTFRQITKHLLISSIFLSLSAFAWYRSPENYRSLATSNLLIMCFWWLSFNVFFFLMSDHQNFERLLNAFVSSSFVLALFGIYQFIQWSMTGKLPMLPFIQYVAGDRNAFIAGLNVPRIESLLHDANLIAIYISIGAVILWRKVLLSKSKNVKMLLIGMLVVHVLAIIPTFSRSGFALFLFTSFLILLRHMKNQNYIWLLLVLSLLLGIGILNGISTNTIYQGYAYRFSEVGQGFRTIMMQTGLRLFLSSPIYGVGWGNPSLLLITKTGIADTTHSFYLTLLVHYGLLGGLLMAIMLWPAIKYSILGLVKRSSRASTYLFASALMPLLFFQIIYDDLFGEVMVVPWVILYSWIIWHSKREH